MERGRFGLYLALIFADFIPEMCYLIFRQHQKWTKLLMEIGLNLCWLALYILMCIYSSQFNDGVYSVELETAVLILIITTIIFSLVIFIANVLIEFVKGPGNKQNIQVQDIIRDKVNPGSDVQIKQ